MGFGESMLEIFVKYIVSIILYFVNSKQLKRIIDRYKVINESTFYYRIQRIYQLILNISRISYISLVSIEFIK